MGIVFCISVGIEMLAVQDAAQADLRLDKVPVGRARQVLVAVLWQEALVRLNTDDITCSHFASCRRIVYDAETAACRLTVDCPETCRKRT